MAASSTGGPPCGWALSYVEVMMAEYRLDLAYIMGADPRHYLSLDAGLALLEARRERLEPGLVVGHVQRAIAKARDAVRAWHVAAGNIPA